MFSGENKSAFENKTAATLKAAKRFFLAKDTKSKKFQNATLPNKNFTGELIYLLADQELFMFVIRQNGTLDPADYANKALDEYKNEASVRLMVYDKNIITLIDKEVTVYQYQNQNKEIQQKQKFSAFKDVEDIAISRFDGMRIFKVKGGKGKFKVFSTLPYSDWNPYIEGVSKTPLLDDKEYPKVELLDAQYGNVVIMVHTGKHYKYFVVGPCSLR